MAARNQFIVPVSEIMTDHAIRCEKWSTWLLMEQFATTESAMKWLATRRLLKNRVLCQRCHVYCVLALSDTGIDGARWECTFCRRRQSIRNGSFFSRSHLSFKLIMAIVYYWANNLPQNFTVRETDVSPRIVLDWGNFCREEAKTFLERNTPILGGFDDDGVPIIVELDETKYFHRKYHRGQWREGHWVVGGIERASKKCFMTEVPDRKAATLEPIIVQYVLPGTHIITDGWAAYNNVGSINYGTYSHSVVVHQEHFVDPCDSEIHTQNVENLWMRAKRKLKWQFGTSVDLFESYLHEFMFRNLYSVNKIFVEFIICVAQNYG